MTRLAVQKPITTLMACLIVALFGWVSWSRLPVDLMPDVSTPTVSVVTLYEGAGPDDIEMLVTRPLERAISAVTGVERMHSSSAEGSSRIRVQFSWGTNIDAAVADVRSKIEQIRKDLPLGIEPPYIRQLDIADFPIMYLGLSGNQSLVDLTRLAEQTIMPQLERLEGVASVNLRGEVQREIQVNLDRSKLEALKMGVREVVDALQRDNINLPAGDYDEGYLRLLVRGHGDFTSIQQVGDTVVRELNGAMVRVRDVAAIVDGEADRTEIVRVNGQPGLTLYIFKQSGANTIQVSDRVRSAIGEINPQLQDAELSLRMDKSDYIREAIANTKQAAWLGAGLAVVVLIVFLRSFRSTLVIGVSMPLSVLATFILMYFQGFTLNLVSFGGLALGIGMLVDNSIVVLESIFRRREEGADRVTAAIEGTREVASAIVASTVTTLIVFMPLLFLGGLTGVLFVQLAWVVSFSLLCSLVASLTLTPVLTAYWIGEEQHHRVPRGLAAGVHALHEWNRRLFDAVENLYAGLLRFCLRWSWGVGWLMVASLAVSIGLVPHIGTELIPKADEGQLTIDCRMAPGVQLEELNETTRQLEPVVAQLVPEVLTTAVFVGGRIDDPDDWNKFRFRMNLPPREERTRDVDVIRTALAAGIGPVPGAEVRVQPAREMMLFRALRQGQGNSDLAVEIRGYDPLAATQLSDAVLQAMHNIPGLVNIAIERGEARPELGVEIDRAKANLLKLDNTDITQTLETAIRGTPATLYREGGDEYDIRVRLAQEQRSNRVELGRVAVAAETGTLIPLRSVVQFETGFSPAAIDRLDQQRVMTVTADIEDRDLGSTVADVNQALARLPKPEGFSIHIGGDWEQQQESFTALQQGFLLALVLMYMVMASQFESLRDPLLILVSIPLAGIGVILALVLTDTTLNLQSFIGLIMLAGIVVNNAIVLLDYIQQLRRSPEQLSLDEIILRASRRRLRPILMTTLTTVLAMLPMAIGYGDGGELQAPMARVVIGGLISATLITLIAIPLLYQACVPSATDGQS